MTHKRRVVVAGTTDAAFACDIHRLRSVLEIHGIVAEHGVALSAHPAGLKVTTYDATLSVWNIIDEVSQAVGSLALDYVQLLEAVRAMADRDPERTQARQVIIRAIAGGAAQLQFDGPPVVVAGARSVAP